MYIAGTFDDMLFRTHFTLKGYVAAAIYLALDITATVEFDTYVTTAFNQKPCLCRLDLFQFHISAAVYRHIERVAYYVGKRHVAAAFTADRRVQHLLLQQRRPRRAGAHLPEGGRSP